MTIPPTTGPSRRFAAALFIAAAALAPPGDRARAEVADRRPDGIGFYTVVPVTAPEYCFDLAAVSDTSLWYTTNRGLYRFNGSRSDRLLDASLFAGGLIEVFLVEALADDDVWVLGHDARNWLKTMYHFDGRSWRRVPFPPSDDDRSDERVLFRFRVARDRLGHYGVGVGQDGLYYTFDGKEWRRRPGFTTTTLRTVELLGRDDIRAAGKDGAIYRFDGKAWVRESPAGFDDTVLELSFSSPSDGWAAANGTLLRYAAGTWRRDAIPPGLAPRIVIAAPGGQAWLFADNGTVLRRDRSSWSVAARMPMQPGYASAGVALSAGEPTYYLVTTAGIVANAWGRIPTFVDVSPGVNIHLDGGEPVVADFDGDGSEDLFVSADGRYADRLYANRGDGFYNEMTARLHPPGRSLASRPAVADLDNNGHPDILAHRGLAENLWYRNGGSWSFTESAGPVAGPASSNYSRLAAADLDLDGDLDLVMMPASAARATASLMIFLNDGVGRFGDTIPLGFPMREGAAPAGFVVSDLDGDGLPDLFKYNVGERTEFYRNEGGGSFVECAADRGLDWSAVDPAPYVTWARPIDIGRDGALDLFVVSRRGLGLFLVNDGGGRFRRGDSIAFDPAGENPAGAFSDIDCDGDQDLFLHDRFHENDGGRFRPLRYPGFRKIGVPVFTDIDGDGDEDFVFRTLKEERGISVYENGIDRGNVVTVEPRGIRSNTHAIGAVVRLLMRRGPVGADAGEAEDGGWELAQSAEVRSTRAVRFALDSAVAYRLEVRFPSGIVVERHDVRPGRMTVGEFGPVEGAWWDFVYSFRRTLLLADPLAEIPKLVLVVAGLAAALAFATRKLALPARHNALFGAAVLVAYVLGVHATIRQGALVSLLYPAGGAAAATTLWISGRNAIERRRRERRISHYVLGEHLGVGGMGKVYAATDTVTGGKVALKVLNQGLLGDPENRKRLMAEGHLLSSISHPHVVKVYEVGDHLGQGFIAMEYLPGGTLRELCASKGPLPAGDAKRISLEICSGLEEIHGRGVIHRDLKSGNVMFGADGKVRLMDFGLSKSPLVTTMTTLGTILGTLGYVSPEQVTNISVDRRADLFSFGVLLYEMTTGRLPFNGENEMAVIHSIFNVEPPPPSSLNPSLPARLDAVVGRLLRKNPGDRYPSADAVRIDLDGDYW